MIDAIALVAPLGCFSLDYIMDYIKRLGLIFESFGVILYHATPLSVDAIVKSGLIASYSQSPQRGVYLAINPWLALVTASSKQVGGSLSLVAIDVSGAVIHPDDDIFDYPESIPPRHVVDEVYVVDGGGSPFDFVKSIISSRDKAMGISVRVDKLGLLGKYSSGIAGNFVFYGDISFGGNPSIVDVGEYVESSSDFSLVRSLNGTLPESIKQLSS